MGWLFQLRQLFHNVNLIFSVLIHRSLTLPFQKNTHSTNEKIKILFCSVVHWSDCTHHFLWFEHYSHLCLSCCSLRATWAWTDGKARQHVWCFTVSSSSIFEEKKKKKSGHIYETYVWAAWTVRKGGYISYSMTCVSRSTSIWSFKASAWKI